MDYSLPGSSVHEISQARTLAWVAISFSRGSSWPRIEPGSPTLQADPGISNHQKKNTLKPYLKLNVGSWKSYLLCLFLLLLSHFSRVRLFATPWTEPSRLLCPWDSPGNSPGVDCHFLLQGIFPTQGSNPGLPHCRPTLYRLSHQGSHSRSVMSNSFSAHGL